MVLIISTPSEKVTIALFKKNIVIDELTWKSYHTQSREILPEINKLLNKNRLGLDDICAIAVYQGPGSYTGLRVGISIANTLAWGLNIPVVGIKGKKENINAFDLGKKTTKILDKKLSKFDKIVTPYYQTKI